MRYLSLFHGIGAVDLAWMPLGWECVAYAEIEPFPIAVTKHHHPDIPNLGDVTKITDERIAALGPIDLVVGGSPCQDLSVAGKRAGLAGERSGLFHEQVRIFHAARALCGARFLLWENVPGAFSSHGGRDFGVVVGAMAGAEFAVPGGGWGTSGAAIGANGFVEWRTLDAQFVRVESHPAAVPQRRRRVFALLDSGAWADRQPVLLELEGLRGHPAPRRETGEGTPARTLRSSDGGIDREDGHTLAAHSLKAEGFDASEDGTGRGVPIVLSSGQANAEITQGHAPTLNCLHEAPVIAFAQNQRDEVRECAGDGALSAEPGMKQQTYLAFSCKDHGTDAAEVAPTLRSMEFDGSHANGGGQVAVAFGWQNSSRQGASASASASVTPTLDKSKVPGLGVGMQVRRLTPRECERLQGFPDDYTLIPVRSKPAADGPRYRALGNSMAVNVMSYIGQRIDAALAHENERDAA